MGDVNAQKPAATKSFASFKKKTEEKEKGQRGGGEGNEEEGEIEEGLGNHCVKVGETVRFRKECVAAINWVRTSM